jgi:hypothetical protein
MYTGRPDIAQQVSDEFVAAAAALQGSCTGFRRYVTTSDGSGGLDG